MRKFLLSLLPVLFPLTCAAGEWRCVNDLEISCDSKSCSRSESFTPMDISFQDSGRIQICAYSGCWAGKGVVVGSRKYLHLSAEALQWNGTGVNPASASLTLDRSSGVATILISSFAMPVLCKPEGAGGHRKD